MKLPKFAIAVFMMVGLIWGACVSTRPQTPPEDAQTVGFGVPEVGTKATWKTIRNGSESTSTTVFFKESFNGTAGYLWKRPGQDVVNVRDLKSNNYMGTWSYSDEEWKIKINPHNGKLQFPLWARKTYSAEYIYWQKEGWQGPGWNERIFSKVNIGDWETITIPAGTFETLKVVQTSQYYTYTTWFSPELKMFIKYIGEEKDSGVSRGEVVEISKP